MLPYVGYTNTEYQTGGPREIVSEVGVYFTSVGLSFLLLPIPPGALNRRRLGFLPGAVANLCACFA